MNEPLIVFSAPIVVDASTVWFSAYGIGWGYAAYALHSHTLCEQFGAADTSVKQLKLSFELGKRRICQALLCSRRPILGERKTLSVIDFLKLDNGSAIQTSRHEPDDFESHVEPSEAVIGSSRACPAD
ncbi:hypothetical protein AWB68_06321 [Caballeronia choica]|jgi:hypothetical protein|uniref:Uncharacterized protein n=1 Tax=Caballeronia choica TaxID=326476 RepID=A0A158KMF8_9BURK|nr:hypothetical protein [Caballeronia choica]SAL81939.1 hypothetical protein AWB68_06321 [Caballeronia choica]